MTRLLRFLSLPAGLLTGACGPRTPANLTPPAVAAADSAIRAAIAGERAIDASNFPQRSVGVTPFRVVSADTTLNVLGVGLADLLVTDLSRSKQLSVVDRLRVDALVRELGLVQSGFVDTSSAPRFGRLVGARRLVMGSLFAGRSEAARLDGRIGDVLSGTLEPAEATATSLDAILDAEKSFAFSILDRLGVSLTPAERALVDQRPTKNLAALLAYSRGVRAELLRDYHQASTEYQAALRLDPRFANARTKLDQVQVVAGPATGPPDLGRVTAMAVEGVNAAVAPQVSSAADPAVRQRLSTTIIIILNLP